METTFFTGKRPWSKIKDQILGRYMPAYLSKVSKLGKPIILIDAFAGPAKFDDNSPGSPLIICQAAERWVQDRYLAIFVNRKQDQHEKLSYVLSRFIEQNKVIPIHGNADVLLARVNEILEDHTVFLYLDPFGLKGCEFSSIVPFLTRDKAFSTEIIVNLSIPIMHRLAARHAVAAGQTDGSRIRAFHKQLTSVLGGEYWKEILWDDSMDAEEKAVNLMAVYRDKMKSLTEPRGFSESCPVREKEGSRLKSYVTFYSRHKDAMLLMNDIMCSAYQQRMHEAWSDGSLFANSNWQENRDNQELEEIILSTVRESPNRSRFDIWFIIVQKAFMRFTASEYKKTVKKLEKEKRLAFKDIRGTRRLNDDAQLYLPQVNRS